MPLAPTDWVRPNVARMYDFFLGGKDYGEADRVAAAKALELNPDVRLIARANRAFLGRAVRYLAERGVRQFLDIGTGLPSMGNVHEVAQSVHADARTVYVDNDRVVLSHGRALLATDDQTVMLDADLRDPGWILTRASDLLDFDRPVAVLLVAILHFVPDEDGPGEIVGDLMRFLVPGSHLVISHVLETERTVAATAAYQRASARVVLRGEERIGAWFTDAGTELVAPGLVRVPLWRPEMDDGLARDDASRVDVAGGVGRKER
ncbi:SAM-dependent methyltransferase [Nonomuraea sp. NPDC049486]|uniref:SAM-dependent methyltransferase n=1 Tax=Nonomuraea harbinensis TaxID=1286938 RepID=A0ABW1BWN1_9ACTN|nr:SAM-dependent methyltransferase [Nonomuraea harbinensis]